MAEASIRPLLRTTLSLVVAINFFVFFALTGWITAPSINSWEDWARIVTPATVITVLTVLLNGLLSPLAKARIIALKWSDPLPGSRAFTDKTINANERLDRTRLRALVPSFPVEPRDQNAIWYGLYRRVENDPAVVNAHKNYLLTRDWTALALLFALGFGPLFAVTTRSSAFGWYFSALLLQIILSNIAARNYGNRFVSTVMARVTSVPEGG